MSAAVSATRQPSGSRVAGVAGSAPTFRILGSLEVERDGQQVALGGAQQQALLALLLIYANQWVPADRLARELWGDPAPARAVKRVQVVVTRLRKALNAGVGAADEPELRTIPGGYRLMVEPG